MHSKINRLHVLAVCLLITTSGALLRAQAQCTAPAGTERICSPGPNATVTNPVHIVGASNLSPVATTTVIYIDYGITARIVFSGPGVDTTLTTLPLAAGTHHLTVKSFNGVGSAKASEFITVSSTGGVSVSISPTSATLAPHGTQQFGATVSGSSNTAVTWSVDGVVGGNSTTGTISTSGLYTAPAAAGSHIVKATSVADTTKSASASVTVTTVGPPPGNVSVLTSKNDNARSGLNPNETLLNPTTVASAQFHKLGSWTLDGFMQAQPLYVPGVQINGSTFNVLYVATENDSVYALNADAPGSAPLWHRSFLGNGVTIGTEFTGGTGTGPHIGITGTPVIDVSSHRLYVLPRTTENGSNVYHMHAIDIRNGADVVPPVLVEASVRGTGAGSDGAGNLPFGAKTQNQRPGLLLSNGVVYAGFASFNDLPPYNGWVIAFEANTLQVLNAYAVSPNGDGGGIWQAGTGLSADSGGAIYVASGNGVPNATALFNPPTDLPNSVLKLVFNGSSFTLADYFAPFNDKCLSAGDLDVGSAGLLVLPDGLAGRNMMVTAGKEGRIYLIDRSNLGKFASVDQVIQEIFINRLGACGSRTFSSNRARTYGAPSYWNGSVYLASAFGPLRQYSITSGTLPLQQVALGTFTYSASGASGRGPITVVSANGASGGVVWTSWRDLSGNGWLHAYDASNVSHLLFSSNYGTGTVFTVPTVANGRVYVTGNTVVFVYGTQ